MNALLSSQHIIYSIISRINEPPKKRIKKNEKEENSDNEIFHDHSIAGADFQYRFMAVIMKSLLMEECYWG